MLSTLSKQCILVIFKKVPLKSFQQQSLWRHSWLQLVPLLAILVTKCSNFSFHIFTSSWRHFIPRIASNRTSRRQLCYNSDSYWNDPRDGASCRTLVLAKAILTWFIVTVLCLWQIGFQASSHNVKKKLAAESRICCIFCRRRPTKCDSPLFCQTGHFLAARCSSLARHSWLCQDHAFWKDGCPINKTQRHFYAVSHT